MFRRRRRTSGLLTAALAAAVALAGWIAISGARTLMTDERQSDGSTVIEQFYSFEQTGDFGSSWELFHPLMQERFSKQQYIETRAHVFLNHFGAQSFEFSASESEYVGEWRMTPDSGKLDDVYKIDVTMKYESNQFGSFEFVQHCYVVEEEGGWKVLWSYNDSA